MLLSKDIELHTTSLLSTQLLVCKMIQLIWWPWRSFLLCGITAAVNQDCKQEHWRHHATETLTRLCLVQVWITFSFWKKNLLRKTRLLPKAINIQSHYFTLASHFWHQNVTERRERFNAANGRRPKSSGTTTWILWMQGVGLNECLIQKKNENLITNKANDKTK